MLPHILQCTGLPGPKWQCKKVKKTCLKPLLDLVNLGPCPGTHASETLHQASSNCSASHRARSLSQESRPTQSPHLLLQITLCVPRSLQISAQGLHGPFSASVLFRAELFGSVQVACQLGRRCMYTEPLTGVERALRVGFKVHLLSWPNHAIV